MKNLERLRNILFWTVDFIKGAKVAKHYKEIKYILENYNSPKAKQKSEINLEKLLQHAVNNTEFYKKNINYESLNDFQVINKNIILDNIDEFKSMSYINKKSKYVSTSGSTGIPLKLIHDVNKKHRNTADNIYFSKLSGFKIGHELLYLRHWREAHRKSKLLAWIQNIYPIEVLDLNDDYISKLINRLEKKASNKGWLGYSSAFETICKYLDKTNSKPIEANVKSIIAMSEGLNSYTKQGMLKYFKAPVVSRYSNMENGIIASQSIDMKNDFRINWASYFVEVLKFNEDKPVKYGEKGRIIVTDFFNFAMPLIRYDTGDVGTIDYSQSPPIFDVIEGRKSDVILDTKGNIISSFIIAEINSFNEIRQSQLIQEEEKKYVLKLNVTIKFDFENEIIKKFKTYLGDDAEILIEYVNEIPLLGSGKRKTTLNNYLSKNTSRIKN